MTQWYVNELSKLTKVSVRTLHYYDKLSLLKPSIRLANGYRLYSEKDLLKLQQIIALKFFGFELSRIKILMQEDINIFDHFRAQQKFLEQKVQSLQGASRTLDAILCESNSHQSVPWETIIKLIEEYHMTQELEHAWVAKVLSPEELKEYASFEQSLKTRYTEAEKKAFEQAWADLVKEIDANLDQDPTSDFAVSLGKLCMDMVNGMYGKEHAALRKSIWEKGYKQGQMEGENDLSPQSVAWLDKAIETYYRRRIYTILNQLETHPADKVLELWNELLEEMYGDAQAPKEDLCKEALRDDQVSLVAKNWLKQTFKRDLS